MVLFAQIVEADPEHSSQFILAAIAALVAAVVVCYFLGLVGWLFKGIGACLRGAVRLGFHQWRRWLSWAPWPVFLAMVIALIVAGWWAVDEYPALTIALGALALLMAMIACLAYVYLDLERYEVERGYKAIHNPLKGQEFARDLAQYGHRVGVLFLAAAAVGMIGGFSLLNYGLYWSVGHNWYLQEQGHATYADFLVYSLLNLYRIVDLLDLANQHRLVRLTHLSPLRWPASALLIGFKTFFTFVLLEQIFASVRKGYLLSEIITDLFSPHPPIHERARHALPQYGVVALQPLLASLRTGPAMTREQREALSLILADIGPATVPLLLRHLKDPNEEVRAVTAGALGHLQAVEALPDLAALQDDPSEAVRLRLVEALGNIVMPGATTIRKKLWFQLGRPGRPLSRRMSWLWKRQRVVKPTADPVALALVHLRTALADSSALVRTLAAKTLGTLGMAATTAAPELVALLADPEEMVRRQAAESLRGIGADAETAVPALISLLEDPSTEVRATAAETLGALSDCADQTLPALVPLLQDRDEIVRQKAAEALGKAGALSRQSTASLVEGLNSSDALVRARTAEALGNIGPAAESAAPALARALQDDNDRVRAKAVKALGKIGASVGETATPNLVRALHDPDTWVQALAAEALGEMGENADQAVPALIRSLEHRNAQIRYHAAESLGKLGRAADPAVRALEKACQDDDPGVRAMAVRALGEVGSSVAQDKLREVCRDADPQVRLAAVTGCAAVESWEDATRAAVIGLLDDTNDQVKVQAARALSKSLGADAELVTHLTALVLADDNAWVQVQAASILGGLGPTASAAGAELAQAATTQEASVREAALKALVQIQPPEAPAAFIAALKDDVADIRRIASAGWHKAGAIPEEALPGLVEALHDPEPQVRANAAYALSRLDVIPAQAVAPLLECTKHTSDELRLNAVLALQKAPAKIVNVLEDLIKDPTPRIRVLAAGCLLSADPGHVQAQEIVIAAVSQDEKMLNRTIIPLVRSLGRGAQFCLPALRERLVAVESAQEREDLQRLIEEFEVLAANGAEVPAGPVMAGAPLMPSKASALR